MNYCEIKSENKDHLRILIKWLFDEVCSAGGDGDGIWYSKYFNAKDIKDFIIEEKLYPVHFKIREESDDSVYFSEGQEGLVITNNKEVFDYRPSWQQVSLVY